MTFQIRNQHQQNSRGGAYKAKANEKIFFVGPTALTKEKWPQDSKALQGKLEKGQVVYVKQRDFLR